ncbi:Regulatory protein E2 [Rhodotorula toruloides ATCC 204091]|uniref:BY PROTMAP: gi/342319274/gb/EGU11224.1/ Regulatory protein E2 [Rhodotorula glutinis ATCC 204091] n=1 Tax=Rhodotorula toruloides TaxID=5286 RepID=A0A0K3CKW5_RHOTO|nr:Regulatory protein E2 [Rhodotorula toruloides ATCC 204091]
MNRADMNISFLYSPPANSFREGVREAVSEEWWAANLSHGDDYLRALAVRDRLEGDERAVGDEWVRRSRGSHFGSLLNQVFCETVVGVVVYKAIAALNLGEEKTMLKCGQAYGALLKSLTTPGNYVNAPGGFYYLNVSNPPLSREDLQLTVSLSQGKPISTTFESLSHRQAATRSSAFFPVSRQMGGRW